jgi:heme-degrading monooxygenase HmoA
MIARHWRALARRERAAEYIHHLRTETFPAIGKIDGFVDATIERRDLAAGVEFLIVTRWRSMDAIREFAGVDPEIAVVPAKVQAMMLELDARVRHYEVVPLNAQDSSSFGRNDTSM